MLNDFPQLKHEGYRETSPATATYNCIAWAAGFDDSWWWPDEALQGYWPEDVAREESVEAFCQAFATLGYESCADAALEEGQEKIAIFARNQDPTHAARQLEDGSWSSKLGNGIDIVHTLVGLEGTVYGTVVRIMKRKR